MGLMEGRDAHHIRGKFQDLYGQAMFANWQVWPLAQVCTFYIFLISLIPSQLINFRFMPLPYRVPFQSTCGVFWTLYLSILNSAYVSSLNPFVHLLISRRSENIQQDRRDSMKNMPPGA